MRSLLILSVSALCLTAGGQSLAQDNRDGTFTNPPLHADYPDPDIIRVGDTFYFVSTTFVNSPGLVVLQSKDLINWKILGHVMDRLEGNPKYDLADGGAYRGGVFAPSLRYHNNMFYVVVTPLGEPTRVYYAKDVKGPWQHHVLNDSAFDPGLLFDDDGTPYIFTSGGWDGQVFLKTLSPTLDRVVASRKLFFYKGIEGSKAFKVDGWYYLFNALPGKMALTCSRARTLDGPWETIEVLDDSKGGHQGAIVDLPDGGWYGFVMCDRGAIGRVTNMSPITWKEGWPLWGDAASLGHIPERAAKPIAGGEVISRPISRDFAGTRLPLEWTWNHNPDDSRWSLTDRPGFLRLRPTRSEDFWQARNTLTHKGWGPASCAAAEFDVSHLLAGDVAGLGMIGKGLATLSMRRADDGSLALELAAGADGKDAMKATGAASIPATSVIHLALQMDFTAGTGQCAFSADGSTWTAIGQHFPLLWDWQTGTFQGEQYALFCFNPKPGEGHVDVRGVRFIDPVVK